MRIRYSHTQTYDWAQWLAQNKNFRLGGHFSYASTNQPMLVRLCEETSCRELGWDKYLTRGKDVIWGIPRKRGASDRALVKRTEIWPPPETLFVILFPGIMFSTHKMPPLHSWQIVHAHFRLLSLPHTQLFESYHVQKVGHFLELVTLCLPAETWP